MKSLATLSPPLFLQPLPYRKITSIYPLPRFVTPTMNLTPIKRAAIAQLCSSQSKHKNLIHIAQCAHLAKNEGASMLFLPECLGFMGNSAHETIENAEAIEVGTSYFSGVNSGNDSHKVSWLKSIETILNKDQERTPSVNDEGSIEIMDNNDVSIIKGLQAIALNSGLWISGGGIHEAAGAPPSKDVAILENQSGVVDTSIVEKRKRVYNTHIIINSEGRIVEKYRKIHLFDVSIPSQGIHLCESSTTAPGSKLVTCDSPIGKLGLSICYDLRFAEQYRALVEEGGACILLVPSAFTVPTGKAHWHTLLKARAIENQSYVFAAAQYGQHNEERASYGHALAVDPWGEIVADAGGSDGEGINYKTVSGTLSSASTSVPGIIICDVNEEKLKSTRERMPVQKHRKNCPFSW